MNINILFYLCCFVLFGFANGQVPQQMLNKLVCIEQEACGACLSAAAHCRWCADPYFSSKVPRCNDDESLVASGCGQGMIQRPLKPVWEVAENRSLQDVDSGSSESVVQIQPQRIRLSLKPRETTKIQFSYRPAKNYPLDLYYLMDLTWSMKDDKETLVSLRDDLPSMLKNLTDNFRLGFGSFADKPVLPYINVDERRRANPCNAEEQTCEPTYSYRHHLSLTNEVPDFIKHVNSSKVTANLDDAEAQLDALVQAVACAEKIGWALHSRKIVILLSDGLLHTAGDGKLGGAIKKNDEQCHLDDNGYYSEYSIYDYPSLAQVYRLLDKYKVNVIFAVTERVKDHYDSIHQLMDDFTYVAKLESDSSNILKLVKMGYEDIVSVVDFEDDSNLGPVRVKYFTDCGVKGGSLIESTRCSGVEYGMTLNYEVHVTLDACPEYKKSNQTILIKESQLGQDYLTLEVEIQCGCDCEGSSSQGSSLNCPVNSHLVCGVCQCNKGWSGPSCDCSIENEAASMALVSQCRDPTSANHMPCSGAGDCLCGECECDPGFSGRYCQCKACQISRENSIECGGVGRGSCVCGQCACADGWSGDACDCTIRNDTCVAPGGTELCSGHGTCACGRCDCASSEEGSKYTGAFCETCATCENPLCAHAEPCVSCYLSKNCTDVCVISGTNYTVAEKLTDADIEDSDAVSCILRVEENSMECEYRYTYSTSTKEMVAMEIIIRAKQCSQLTSARLMTSALIIMACVVAGGIMVIMGVKSAQIVSDRRAYAKFIQEAEESRLNTQELNPLYISPISEFRLPDSFPRDKND
ncbi:integrin betanu subunit [Choristoneura fumiferana]|uniref:integrin betanu subunit n=1 Tax=Choristoneura fumiferana TaxID=7141 RepID=UPI003D1567E0